MSRTRNPFDPADTRSGNPFDPSNPSTATGEQLRHDMALAGWPWSDATRRILAIEAEAAAGHREGAGDRDRREAALESLMREAYPYVNASTAPNELLFRIDALLAAPGQAGSPESRDE